MLGFGFFTLFFGGGGTEKYSVVYLNLGAILVFGQFINIRLSKYMSDFRQK